MKGVVSGMDITFLLRGFVIGLSIAAPIGPINVLCISRTLAEGRLIGIVSGLGGATADVVYGCVAGFGLTFVSSILINQQAWLRLIGGLFLCYLGAKTFLAEPAKRAASSKGNGLVGAYTSTFFLTLTNPMTILSFVALFAGLGLASTGGNFMSATSLVFGIFIGSSSWFLILCSSVDIFRGKLSPSRMQWINRISGAIIAGFGLVALLG
ncbi:MAG: LysE family translocator [Methanothrix sp.]|jgi:threonine/homoserine/homoserine lactone efflux protein|nr:LysE family translocator [Methanothrix sp.]